MDKTHIEILREQVESGPLYQEQKQRYNKEWLSNMTAVAMYSAIITVTAYYLPKLISLLHK